MESLFKNPIIRNLLAIALGVVIIINPQLGPNIVIMLIGATLAIPALLAIIGYFSYKNKETPMPGYVLVESIGALVIGAWMLLQPTFFNAVILIALGIILLLAGISQIISLIRSGQIMPIPIGMYIVPVLITIAGLLMIFKPFGTVNLIMTIFGISMAIYGISDMIRYYKFRR